MPVLKINLISDYAAAVFGVRLRLRVIRFTVFVALMTVASAPFV